MIKQPLQDNWIKYENETVRANMNPVILAEIRRAFYGGAHVMLGMLIFNKLGTEAERAELLKVLHAEINNWVALHRDDTHPPTAVQ